MNGTNEKPRFTEWLPGKFAVITGGGTRNQLKLLPNSLELPKGILCPFEAERGEEGLDIPGIPEGWRVLGNKYTPHLNHLLCIPSTCWPMDALQNLGGVTVLAEALSTLWRTTADYGVETSCFTHIGRAAGQNQPHHHWHAMRVLVRRPLDLEDFTEAMKPERIIARDDKFTVFAGGAHAGECLIVPHNKIWFRESLGGLANVISHVVTKGNEKFSNPVFIVTVRISSTGVFRYADYCPILNFWGSPEYITAPLEGGPITVPHSTSSPRRSSATDLFSTSQTPTMSSDLWWAYYFELINNATGATKGHASLGSTICSRRDIILKGRSIVRCPTVLS